jgi:S1-C subfamily serine protease
MPRTAWMMMLLLLWGGCVTELDGSAEPQAGSPSVPPVSIWLGTSEPDGAALLEGEAQRRPALARYMSEYGRPDRVLLAEHGGLRVIYLDRDLFLTFQRGSPVPASRRVPPRVLQRLDAADRARVLAARDASPRAAAGNASIIVGSCFVVSPEGLLLTVDHAARQARAIRIRLADGSSHPAEVVTRLPESDLALLRIDAEQLDYLPLTDAVQLGEPVFTIGFPAVELLGVGPKFSAGAISGLEAGPGQEGLLLTSVPVLPGNSGGPLVNEQGEVLGIVVAQAEASRFLAVIGQAPQNISYAIRVSKARDLFQAPKPPRPATSRQEAIQRARSASCLIVARTAEPAGQ